MRLTKGIVLGSTLLAFAAHAWLLSLPHPWLWWVVGIVFAASVIIAKLSLSLGLVAPLVLAYLAPAVLMVLTKSTDHNLILLWLALLAGPIFAGSDWRRWHTPARWNIALVAWAVILALTWPIIALREIDFSLIAATTLNTPNGLLAPPPPLSAASIVLNALGQLLGLLWLDFLWARFGTMRLSQAERLVGLTLMLSVALACIAALWQKSVDLTFLSVEPWPRLERATGLMLDANSFGTAAAIWAPLTVALAWRLNWPTPLGGVLAIIFAAGMWMSGSRTALLIAVTGAGAIAVAVLWRSRAWQQRYVPLAMLLSIAITLVALSVRGSDDSSPIARLIATFPQSPDGGVSQFGRNLWERDGYGIAAARAVAEHPWTGVGVGAFPLLAPEYFYLETGGLIPGDNAQNWWRHQVAEFGLIGALPAVATSLGILLMLVVGSPAPANRAVVTLLRGTLLGIGLASLVGVGTQHPALFLTFVTLVFWLGALLDGKAGPPAPHSAWWGVIAVALLVAAGQIYSASHDLRVPHRAVEHGFTYGYGFSEPQFHPALGMVRQTARHAVGVIPAEHAYFNITLIAPHATSDQPVQVKLWRGSELIVDQRVAGQEPIVRYVAIRPGEKQLMIELDVSHTADDGTGVWFAGTWVRELPLGTHPDLVAQ